jgi:hypothetical protein
MSNRRIIISESERRRIKNLYETPVSLDFVISDWLSPDEKYAIFLDELYDIESKTKLGNIWENFDNFKFFLKHSFEVSTTVPQQIKEDVLKTLDSFLLTESTQNLTQLKPIFKQLLKEDWGLLGDLGNWAKETAISAVDGVTNFVKTGYEGLQKLNIAISQGDWSKIVDLLKKGALYVARSIRSALYHPVGLIFDAILIATGVGKGLQFVIWAIVVGLDIYEFISGDFEKKDENILMRLLFFGIDILGMVFSGTIAKSSKGFIGGILRKFGTTTEGLSMAAKSNPQFKNLLNKILNGSTKASSFMSKAAESLKTTSPMMYKFLSGVLGGLTKFINLIVNSIMGILGLLSVPGKIAAKLGAGKVGQGLANAAVPLAALGTYQTGEQRKSNEEFADALQNSDVVPDYS